MQKPFKPLDVARLSEAEVVAREDELFCICQAGQAQRRAHQRRYDALRAEIAAIEASNAVRRAAKASAALASRGVPKRFADATLETLSKRVSYTDGIDPRTGAPVMVIEPAKAPGIYDAYELRDTGVIALPDGRVKYSLLLWGRPPGGTGKTTCLSGVFNHWRDHGRTGVWTTFAQLLLEIRAGYDDHNANARIREVQEVDVLLLDDIGEYSRAAITQNTMEILSWIIYHRHAWDKTTLFSTNWAPAQLQDALTPQIWTRILEMANVVEFGGERLRQY